MPPRRCAWCTSRDRDRVLGAVAKAGRGEALYLRHFVRVRVRALQFRPRLFCSHNLPPALHQRLCCFECAAEETHCRNQGGVNNTIQEYIKTTEQVICTLRTRAHFPIFQGGTLWKGEVCQWSPGGKSSYNSTQLLASLWGKPRLSILGKGLQGSDRQRLSCLTKAGKPMETALYSTLSDEQSGCLKLGCTTPAE